MCFNEAHRHFKVELSFIGILRHQNLKRMVFILYTHELTGLVVRDITMFVLNKLKHINMSN